MKRAIRPRRQQWKLNLTDAFGLVRTVPRPGALALSLLSALLPVAGFAAPGDAGQPASRSCSLAEDEIVRIASWDLEGAFSRIDSAGEATAEMAAMLGLFNADVVALQGLSAEGRELTSAIAELRRSGRCFLAVRAPGGLAVVFDPEKLDPGYVEGTALDCDGKRIASATVRQPRSDRSDAVNGQLAWFRVKDDTRPGAFDFALLNADPGQEGLDRLAERYTRLGEEHAWLGEERDLIVLGDLVVDSARLSRQYFPGTKPLINLLLKINIGASDKSFDEAVAAAMRPGSEASRYNDNILVRRWDQPGTCPGAGYCGGLEEFINARIYPRDAVNGRKLTVLGEWVHPPVAARFCRFADSDPTVALAR